MEGSASHDRETECDLLLGGSITCGWEELWRKSGIGSGDIVRDRGEREIGFGVMARGGGEGDQDKRVGD